MTLVSESQIIQGETAIGVFNEDAVSMRGVIRNNRIDHFSGGQMGAIQLTNLDHDLEVDVIGNEIRGSNYNYGIIATQSQNGTSRYRILDNLDMGQKSVAGIATSYGIRNTGGDCDFQIVNNTAANGDQGIRADGGGPQVTTGIVANNIVANMTAYRCGSGAPVVVERNNLIWASHSSTTSCPVLALCSGIHASSADRTID
jgi:hypothetical protein